MTEKFFKETREYFQKCDDAFFFISATNFNLIDMHNWVGKWKNVNLIDCFDKTSSSCLIPDVPAHKTFSSIEEINEFLLNSPALSEEIRNGGLKKTRHNALFLFFNSSIEEACKKMNLQLMLPENALREHIDSKIVTTEIGNEAGVSSVENILTRVTSYQDLLAKCEQANLGRDVVIQTPYGDSGKTTFFVSTEADYDRCAAKITSEEKVKIMKRIHCVGTAIEACATSEGTYVGPLLGELIGLNELTPYTGGWCGNELYQDQFSSLLRSEIHEKTEKLGNILYKKGYRGYFEVDYLIDLVTNRVYLGEINPRITGITAMTNLSPFCQSTIPLFFFHLLEYSKQKIGISTAAYNAQSLRDGAMGTTGQLIMKAEHSELRRVVAAPASGVYRLGHSGELELVKRSSDPIDKSDSPDLVFLLRILKEGDFSYYGADKVILFLNTKLTTDRGTKLSEEAKKWVEAVNQSFKTITLNPEELTLAERYTSPANIKGPE